MVVNALSRLDKTPRENDESDERLDKGHTGRIASKDRSDDVDSTRAAPQHRGVVGRSQGERSNSRGNLGCCG